MTKYHDTFTPESLVPVRYLPGSGGMFLASFLGNANNNQKSKLELSPEGNCHSRVNEFFGFVHPTHNLAPDQSDELKISAIYSTFAAEGEPPYFVHTHLVDVKKTLEHFPKVISISCTYDDAHLISQMLIYKFAKEAVGDTMTMDELQFFVAAQTVRFLPYYDETNKMNQIEGNFHVPFSLMIRGDEQELISLLSNITGIPTEDFDVEFLRRWRKTSLNFDPLNEPRYFDFAKRFCFSEAGNKPVVFTPEGNGYFKVRPQFMSLRDLQKRAFVDGENREILQDSRLANIVMSRLLPKTILGAGAVTYFKKFFSFDETPSGEYEFAFLIENSKTLFSKFIDRVNEMKRVVAPGGHMYVAVNRYLLFNDGVYTSKLPKNYNFDLAILEWILEVTGFQKIESGYLADLDGKHFNDVHPTTYILLRNSNV